MSYRIRTIKINKEDFVYSGEIVETYIINTKEDSIKCNIDFTGKISDFDYIEIIDINLSQIVYLKNDFTKRSFKKLQKIFAKNHGIYL